MLAISLLSRFVSKKISKIRLKKKIVLKETQLKVLGELVKKTQSERFKENKIPALVYNIRVKNYKDKIEDIKRELPVLKSNFARMNRRSKKK